jgi:hypothetical protein
MADKKSPVEQQMAAYSNVIRRAWQDPAYKERLLGDPSTVLRESGFEVPEGSKVHIVENQPDHIHFVLPKAPTEAGGHKDLPFHEADLPFHEVEGRSDLPFHGAAPLPFHNVELLPFMSSDGN